MLYEYANYLEESCKFSSYQHFFFMYFKIIYMYDRLDIVNIVQEVIIWQAAGLNVINS